MDGLKTKILLTVAVAIVAVSSSFGLADKALNSMPGAGAMNRKCEHYLSDWTKKSVATFAVTKSINAGLSIIEDSELQFAVVNVAAGEVVGPLNDMVEKVSSVALASAVSLGIQRMLMEIGAWVGLTWFLTASMLCWLVVVWMDSSKARRLAWGLLLVAVVAKFLIPAAVLATGYVGDRFTERAYAKAQHQLEQLDAEAKKAKSLDSADTSSKKTGGFGVVTKAATVVTQVPAKIEAMISRLSRQAEIYNEVAITYLVIFILQTMLMPILILLGLIKLLGFFISPAAIAGVEGRLTASAAVDKWAWTKSLQTPEVVNDAQG